MRMFFATGTIMCAAILAGSAHAQSIEASRYVNGQGIEVIQGRTPPAAAASVTEKKSAPVSSPGAITTPQPERGARGSADKGSAASDPRMRVSSSEQQSRDKDRLAILNDELSKEMGDYATQSKVLKSPSMRDKLPAAELERLRELAAQHEKNIQALMSEIAGVRK